MPSLEKDQLSLCLRATRTTAFEDEVGGYSTVTLNGLEVIWSHNYDCKDLENDFGCSLKVENIFRG